MGIALAGVFWAASARAQPTTQPATQPTTQPAADALDARAAQLAMKVLADPLDATARMNLRQLRAEQARRRTSAYLSLAAGLEAYLAVGPEVAAAALTKAARSPKALSLAAGSSKSPADILAEAARAARSAPAAAKDLCRHCGGTGEVFCRVGRCFGSGKAACSQCKGAGVIRARHPLFTTFQAFLCGKCQGPGVTGCTSCNSTGTQPCPACKGKKVAGAGPTVDARTRQALRGVIAKARLLAGGRIDLYTEGARKPSPR
jgi:hypothetical protein